MPRRDVEEPVTHKGKGIHDGDRTTHPSFAVIGASRVSGFTSLFQSDFNHTAYMMIRIKHATLDRDLAHDWVFGKEQIIEVAMSESQWATFVSSPNIGDGVPCTLTWTEKDGQIPPLPDPRSKSELFKKEVEEKLGESIQNLLTLQRRISEMGLPKGKIDTIVGAIGTSLSHLRDYLPFAAASFEEHMEQVVEKAKQEVHGYMSGVLMRSGLAALQGQPMPLQLPDATKEDDT